MDSTKSSKAKDYGTLKRKSTNSSKKQDTRKKGRRSRSYEEINKSKHKKEDIKGSKNKRLPSSGQISKESNHKKHKSRRSKSVSVSDDRHSSVGHHSRSRSSSRNCYTSERKRKYTCDRKDISRSRSSSLKKTVPTRANDNQSRSHSRSDYQHVGVRKEIGSPGQKKRNSSKFYSLQDDKEDDRKTKKRRSCSSSSSSKNEKSLSPAGKVYKKRNRSSSRQDFRNKEDTKTHEKSPSPKRVCRSENERDNSDKKKSRNLSLSPKRSHVNSSSRANKVHSPLEKKDSSHSKNKSKQSKLQVSQFEAPNAHKKLKSSGKSSSDTSSLSYSPVDRNPERYQDILPKPVVHLHSSGSEDETVELREREDDEEDQEKEMKTLR